VLERGRIVSLRRRERNLVRALPVNVVPVSANPCERTGSARVVFAKFCT